MGYSAPGDPYSLRIYNSAGEFIKNMDLNTKTTPISKAYSWDGTNYNGDKCASGVYILYLIEPYERHLKRLILVW